MFEIASVSPELQVALKWSATAAGDGGVGREMVGSDIHELSGRFLLTLVQDLVGARFSSVACSVFGLASVCFWAHVHSYVKALQGEWRSGHRLDSMSLETIELIE